MAKATQKTGAVKEKRRKAKAKLAAAKERDKILAALKDNKMFLTAKQEAQMKEQIKGIERDFELLHKWYGEEPDPETITALTERHKRLTKSIDAGRPPEVSDSAKNLLWDVYNKKRAEIAEDMPSKDEMMGKRCNEGKGREAIPSVVERQIRFQKKHGQTIRMLKNIATIIDRDNPGLRDVESWRKPH